MVTSLSQKIADLRSNGRIPLLLSTVVDIHGDEQLRVVGELMVGDAV